MSYTPRGGQFSVAANRFDWELSERKGKPYERHRAALVFKRVQAVRTIGIDRRRLDDVLSVLAIRFTPKGEGPEGTIELSLAGTGQHRARCRMHRSPACGCRRSVGNG